jgi:cobalt/nickel transport system permease protein
MMHDSIDRYSGISPFSAFDPRAKLLGILAFAVCISLLQNLILLFISVSFMLCMLALSGIPARHIAGRFAVAFPFALFAALTMWWTSGEEQALAMFLRISASVLGLILLITTTQFFDLLNGLQRLRVPEVMITLLMFTYRYIFVFSEELERMKIARRAKAYKSGRSFLNRKTMDTITNTIGMVLVRAYERGLRVLDSLRARGYDGRIRTLRELKFAYWDYCFCAILIFMPAMLLCYEWGLVA